MLFESTAKIYCSRTQDSVTEHYCKTQQRFNRMCLSCIDGKLHENCVIGVKIDDKVVYALHEKLYK